MTEALLEAKDIAKTYYRGRQPIKALDNLSLTVQPGDFLVIEGVSGSGKTTLLQLLGALDSPTSGQIKVGQIDITKARRGRLTKVRRRHIGFIFQSFNLIPTLTAQGNVEAALVGSGMWSKKRREKAAMLLEKVGLGDRAKHLPGKLSGGEQQRVAIARALANEPDIILADEPTGDLDGATSEQIMDLLKALTVEGKRAVIVVTHDPTIRRYATHRAKMVDGRLLVG